MRYRTGREVDPPRPAVSDDMYDVDVPPRREELGHLHESRARRVQHDRLDAKLQFRGKETNIPHRRVDERHLTRSDHDCPWADATVQSRTSQLRYRTTT